jgi:CRISPR system Cascade subunit CasA
VPFNLLTDPAFPVVTARGECRRVAVSDLARADGPDTPVDFDWPRADLNIASYELVIGVATLAFQPTKPSHWLRLWTHPPGPDDVRRKIAPFAHAFDLDGDGPRFLQEFGGLDGETNPVEALLIDTPGVNGQKKNADLLTHRARYPALGLPAAAMALYALQQFAPSGGAGNRTSMRGGGPLTTLVIPGARGGERSTLWRTILANLDCNEDYEWEAEDLPRILPWLAPTLTSKNERQVHEGDEDHAHPLQAFFGMPRRAALRVSATGACSMTGEEGPLVTECVQKPWGVNYGLWSHPLTPYRQQKEGAEPYSVKPKSSRFGYRDWVAVTVGEKNESGIASPAPAVRAARSDRIAALRGGDLDARLQAGGWAMNNMEAVAYLFAEQPLHLARSPEEQAIVDAAARRSARAADIVANALVGALRDALFGEGAKPSTDKTLFDAARAGFFEATEDTFHAMLNATVASPSSGESHARGWLNTMTRAAAKTFDTFAPVPVNEPERAGRIADAFGRLRGTLAGYGKAGGVLLETLGLVPPETKGKKGGSRGR